MNDENRYLKKIVSGGQTGADRAALDVAIRLGIPHGGWIPKGRITEAGFLPSKYRMKEMPTASYALRTEQNVIDSDGTLIISRGKLTGGSALTAKYAAKHDRSCRHIDLNAKPHLEAALNIAAWVMKNRIEILNIAGPRASKDPGIYDAVSDVLESAIHLIRVEKFQPRYKKPEDGSDIDIIDSILGEMPLREKSGIADMNKDQMAILQQAFEMYIRSKTDPDTDDEEFNEIMLQLWESLQENHRVRVAE